MRKILAEALIIALETGLVLAIVAALGVPAGKGPKAAGVSRSAGSCVTTGDCPLPPGFADFSRGNWPADQR